MSWLATAGGSLRAVMELSILGSRMKVKLAILVAIVPTPWPYAADLRIGIIGCDTSHVTAFTETLNNPDAKGHITGGEVVAAYSGGSPDIPSSASRVKGYTKTLVEKYGVKIYKDIGELCQNVDVV